MREASAAPTLLHRLVSFVGAGYLHFVGVTSFVMKVDDPAYLAIRRRREPVIYAFWHRHQISLAYAHRGESASILVSRSRDGEYVAQVMRRLGLNAVRGSNSRGGMKSLLRMIQLVDRGAQIGFSPDGPKGPAKTIHGGVILAAFKSGAPVVAVGAHCSRRIEFDSWDRFVLPLPAGRVAVAHGAPIRISPEMGEDRARETLRQAMDDAEAAASAAVSQAGGWFAGFSEALFHGAYRVAGWASAPIWIAALLFQHGFRRSASGFRDRLGRRPPKAASSRRLWFHAASVGEWRALAPVLDAFSILPHVEAFVTVSTPESRDLIRRERPDLSVQLLPADLPGVIPAWIRRVDPDAVLIVETELWPVMIETLSRRDVPVFLVNGRLSPPSARRWRWGRPLIRRTLRTFSGLFARSDQDAAAFRSLGAPSARIRVLGNTKTDILSVLSDHDRAIERKFLAGESDDFIVVAGSTWPGEESIFWTFLRGDNGRRLVLAPRRFARVPDVFEAAVKAGFSTQRLSAVKDGVPWASRVLIVDTIGDLARLYGAADAAFVGGSLVGRGGQNPLEPAAARTPVLFGPSMENFHDEAGALIEAGGAIPVADETAMQQALERWSADPAGRRSAGARAAATVATLQGASRRTADAVIQSLGWERL